MLKEGLENPWGMPEVDEIVYGYDALGRRMVREEYRETSWWWYGSGEVSMRRENLYAEGHMMYSTEASLGDDVLKSRLVGRLPQNVLQSGPVGFHPNEKG